MIHPNSEIPEFDITIIGSTGDLSIKKILPALLKRYLDGQILENSKIFCLARQRLTNKEYINLLKKNIAKKIKGNNNLINKFLSKIKYHCIDVTNPNNSKLISFQNQLTDNKKIRLFYFATAPELFGVSAKFIKLNNLINNKTRIIVEKPIGNDLPSAIKINNLLNKYFKEEQIYRIDHYLGKETVQNLMAMRFANQIFESQWNNNSISNIQITVSEEIGIEGREAYYDTYGAIKDMMQNHILQLVCLVAMEPPSKFDANLVRNEKLKILQSLQNIERVEDFSIGQYGNNNMVNKPSIHSYLEDSKNSKSITESFAALKININNWRWNGVPFFLRTGKRLKKRVSEIVVTFKPIKHFIFDESVQKNIKPNQLIIRLQPDEGLKLLLMSKEPGPGGMRIAPSYLNLSFSDTFKKAIPDAYERLLMDVVRGNQTLFMSKDEVEAAWNWIDPIVELIKENNLRPEIYTPGTWGPNSSNELIKQHGFKWYEPDVTGEL